MALTVDLGQLDRSEPVGQGGECAAGFDRGELALVADQDDLRSRMVGVVEQCCELARANHPGLVDNHDDAGRQRPVFAAVEIGE
jgi:hypothetical protein